MHTLTVQLPGGYIDRQGLLQRDVMLRALGGREEEFLATSRGASSAARLTTLLSNCIVRLGTLAPPTSDDVRNLLVGDRQFLLLKLRELTFGEQIMATIHCPWPHCGRPMDLDFSVHDVPVHTPASIAPAYTCRLSAAAAWFDRQGQSRQEVVFRLPTGADQEALAELARSDPAQAMSGLFQRCILVPATGDVPDGDSVAALSPQARREIETAMKAAAPAIDLNLESTCAACGRFFRLPFDLQALFFGELRIDLSLLYREVHYLAFHYHWSEQEIMAMPRPRRRSYIETLADEIEKLNYGTT